MVDFYGKFLGKYTIVIHESVMVVQLVANFPVKFHHETFQRKESDPRCFRP